MNDLTKETNFFPQQEDRVVFDAACVRRFAEESHDVNPRHMDEDHARKSAFGQLVVFGALAGLTCLERLRDAPGWEREAISLEFRHPVFMGVEYSVRVERTDARRAIVALRDGKLTLLKLAA